MKAFPLYLAATLVLSSPLAMAGASGLSFSSSEIARNKEHAKQISYDAAMCLQERWKSHVEFYAEHKYSKYYGDRNTKYWDPDSRKLAILKEIRPDLFDKADEAQINEIDARIRAAAKKTDPEAVDVFGLKDYLAFVKDQKRNMAMYNEIKALDADLRKRESELEGSACVTLARDCLKRAFGNAGMSETWTKIDAHVKAHGVSGVELQKALVDLGWVSLYWNPDSSMVKAWDLDDQNRLPPEPGKKRHKIWADHEYNFLTATVEERRPESGKKNQYDGIPITDNRTLRDFGTNPPEVFVNTPFFVGIAHMGYHVFPGSMGRVVEAHSMRSLGARDNLEFGRFNPLDQENGGAPVWTNSERYRSGVLVVPPGMLGAGNIGLPSVPLEPSEGNHYASEPLLTQPRASSDEPNVANPPSGRPAVVEPPRNGGLFNNRGNGGGIFNRKRNRNR